MTTDTRNCRRCGAQIPAARVEAIPDTLVCVHCSQAIGGEFESKVTISGTGKPGSLKQAGQDAAVRRQRKPLR